MTLWPVSDTDTVRVMTDFYARLAQDSALNPAVFSQVQRDALVRLRDSKGLEPAILAADGFVLTSEGKP